MKSCTFFGHRYVGDDINEILYNTIIHLIENEKVTNFYVGNQGGFDSMVSKILRTLKTKYRYISYAIVLAYIPKKNENKDFLNTIYPEGLEFVLPKFAIIKRNNWMIEKSEFVVVYVKDMCGGAAKFKEIAEKKGKKVINIAEKINQA